MGPSHHVWFLDAKQRLLDRINKSLWVPGITRHFGAELQVSMCPSSHLWFLHAQQRILDLNFKSVRVPDFICGFVHT